MAIRSPGSSLACCLLAILPGMPCAWGLDQGAAVAHVAPPESALLTNLPVHPRLCLGAGFAARLAQHANDPFLVAARLRTLAEADTLLTTTPLGYVRDGAHLTTCRQIEGRIVTLALAWQLTGSTPYAQRARDELLAAAAFPDWNPGHFLDTASLACGCALGYDWLADALSVDERMAIRRALIDKALLPSLATPAPWWIADDHNWNQICHSALALAALAIGDAEPALATRILERSLAKLPLGLAGYAPDGAYPEGPSYWAFALPYQVLAISGLETALGIAPEALGGSAFLESARYMQHACGPTGLYHAYGDASEHIASGAAPLWFAQRLGDAALQRVFCARYADECRQGPADRFAPLALLWYDPRLAAGATTPVRDWNGGGQTPVAFMRSAWDNPLASFVGIKGGSPGLAHGHMDVGSFVFDSQGVRWASDLGKEDYYQLERHGVQLWDKRQDGDRWKVLRHGSAAHGILTFSGRPQAVAGHARIAAAGLGTDHPAAELDCTTLYPDEARSVVRRITFAQRRELVVEDRIVAVARDGTLRWQLATLAHAELDPAGIRLTRAGATLRLCAQTSGAAAGRWRIEDLSAPRAAFDSPNPGASLVVFTLPVAAGDSPVITVTLTPEAR